MTPFHFIDWPCPSAGGGTHEEMALVFDRNRVRRLLVLPAWFDEANKMRRQTVEVMRRLDLLGIDSMLPDFPGCNESEASLAEQTLQSWRQAAAGAAEAFRATHVLTIRSGALLAPADLPGWTYSPVGGAKLLRGMLRARTIASREAGKAERAEDLQAVARDSGIELSGWAVGAEMFRALEDAEPGNALAEIGQDLVGGTGLWRRAEPDEDPEQADALAALIAIGLSGQ